MPSPLPAGRPGGLPQRMLRAAAPPDLASKMPIAAPESASVAQLCHAKRTMGALELTRCGLEHNLHDAVAERDRLAAANSLLLQRVEAAERVSRQADATRARLIAERRDAVAEATDVRRLLADAVRELERLRQRPPEAKAAASPPPSAAPAQALAPPPASPPPSRPPTAAPVQGLEVEERIRQAEDRAQRAEEANAELRQEADSAAARFQAAEGAAAAARQECAAAGARLQEAEDAQKGSERLAAQEAARRREAETKASAAEAAAAAAREQLKAMERRQEAPTLASSVATCTSPPPQPAPAASVATCTSPPPPPLPPRPDPRPVPAASVATCTSPPPQPAPAASVATCTSPPPPPPAASVATCTSPPPPHPAVGLQALHESWTGQEVAAPQPQDQQQLPCPASGLELEEAVRHWRSTAERYASEREALDADNASLRRAAASDAVAADVLRGQVAALERDNESLRQTASAASRLESQVEALQRENALRQTATADAEAMRARVAEAERAAADARNAAASSAERLAAAERRASAAEAAAAALESESPAALAAPADGEGVSALWRSVRDLQAALAAAGERERRLEARCAALQAAAHRNDSPALPAVSSASSPPPSVYSTDVPSATTAAAHTELSGRVDHSPAPAAAPADAETDAAAERDSLRHALRESAEALHAAERRAAEAADAERLALAEASNLRRRLLSTDELHGGAESELAELRQQHDMCARRLSDAAERAADAERLGREERARAEAVQAELHAALNDASRVAAQNQDELRAQGAELRHLAAEVDRRNAAIEDLRERLAASQRDAADLMQRFSASCQDGDHLRASLQAAEQRLEVAQRDHRRAQLDWESARVRMADAAASQEERLREAVARAQALDAEAAVRSQQDQNRDADERAIERRRREAEARLADAESRCDAFRREASEAAAELHKARAVAADCDRAIRDAVNARDEARRLADSMRQELSGRADEASRLHEEKGALERRLRDASRDRSRLVAEADEDRRRAGTRISELQLQLESLNRRAVAAATQAEASMGLRHSSGSGEPDAERLLHDDLLRSLPIGSIVEPTSRCPPGVAKQEGTVLAHAVAPDGSAGALVEFPPPLGQRFLVCTDLVVLRRGASLPGSPPSPPRSAANVSPQRTRPPLISETRVQRVGRPSSVAHGDSPLRRLSVASHARSSSGGSIRRFEPSSPRGSELGTSVRLGPSRPATPLSVPPPRQSNLPHSRTPMPIPPPPQSVQTRQGASPCDSADGRMPGISPPPLHPRAAVPSSPAGRAASPSTYGRVALQQPQSPLGQFRWADGSAQRRL